MTGAGGATLTANFTSITIVATDTTATEAGTTTGQFTVTRNGLTVSALAVNFTIGGSAANGSDYTTITSPVTIPAGSASTTITVTPIDDSVVESDETVALSLATGTGYGIGTPSGDTVTIQSDDSTVSITANDPTATEAGTTTGQFTITRTGGNNAASLSVAFSIGGTATNGADYNTLASPVIIPAGSASTTVTVTPIDDNAVESGETVVITLLTGSYGIGSPSTDTVTIQSDDSNVSITANDPTATEAGPTTGQFTITRSGGSNVASLAVNFSINGSAINGTDYASITSPVTIPAGSASATVTVTPVDDSLVEGDETVTLTLTTGTGYTVATPSSDTVTIQSDDSTVTVTANDPTATEAGMTTGQFTISRGGGSNAASLAVTINITGTAINGTDYNPITSAVTIPASSSSATVTITPIDDVIAETDETVVFTVTTGAGYSVGSPSTATVTIQSDDAGLIPPGNVVATALSATSVALTWLAAPGATQYEIWRASDGAVSSLLTMVGPVTAATDSTVIAGHAYVPDAHADLCGTQRVQQQRSANHLDFFRRPFSGPKNV